MPVTKRKEKDVPLEFVAGVGDALGDLVGGRLGAVGGHLVLQLWRFMSVSVKPKRVTTM